MHNPSSTPAISNQELLDSLSARLTFLDKSSFGQARDVFYKMRQACNA